MLSICAGFYELMPKLSITYAFFFHFFLVFVLASYVRTVFTDPGRVPPEFSVENEVLERASVG